MAAPATPTPQYPPNGGTNIDPHTEFSWTAEAGTVTYYVQWSWVADFATAVGSVTFTGVIGTTNALTNSRTYYWRVRAENADGSSAWSTVYSFTTIGAVIPEIPPLRAPLNAAIDVPTSTLLQWFSVPNAILYEIDISTDSLFNYFVGRYTSFTTDITVSGLVAGTIYYWRVRAKSADTYGSYSMPFMFTTATSQITNSDKFLQGSVSMSGSLSMTVIIGADTSHYVPLGGTIGMSGGISVVGWFRGLNVIIKNIGGSIALSGGVSHGLYKALTGAITPSGRAFIIFVKGVGGTITSAGTTLVTIHKNLGGTLKLAGSLFKIIPVNLSGRIGMYGKAFRTVPVNLAGSISPSGVTRLTRFVVLNGEIAVTKTFTKVASLMERTYYYFKTLIRTTYIKTKKERD